MKNIFSRISKACYVSKLEKKIEKMCSKYHCSFSFPIQISNGLDDIIGMNSEKDVLQDALLFFKELTDCESSFNIHPNSRFLLFGASGSGKSELVAALAKSASVPLFTVPGQLFERLKKQETLEKVLNTIFDIAESFGDGIVLNFDEFCLVIGNENSEQVAIHMATRIRQCQNVVVFLSSSSGTAMYSKALFGDNLFNVNKRIVIMPPTLETREALIKKYFNQFEAETDENVSAERLAKQTYGMYPKDLEYLVRETILYARRQGHVKLTYRDFNETLLLIESGAEYNKMTEKERNSTAFHEAGHVLAGYYSDPDYILGRVEITPRAMSLGLTQEEQGEEKFCMFCSELKSKIIYSLGGMAAEKIIFNETSSGVSSDLESANALALAMVCDLGMNEHIGPVIYDAECGVSSEYFITEFDKEIQKTINELYATAQEILSKHLPVLNALAKALLEKEVLMGDEIKEIILKTEPDAEKNRNYCIQPKI